MAVLISLEFSRPELTKWQLAGQTWPLDKLCLIHGVLLLFS